MLREVTEFSAEEIQKGLQKARESHGEINEGIRILFAPATINTQNFNRVCDIYSRLNPTGYETVVVVEEHPEVLGKKLPMPSTQSYKTPLGEVPVNDPLRNEFCDEDDDFFIFDPAYSEDMSLFHQLMMLQNCLNDFNALSIQIADKNQFILKELVHALQEVMASKNGLLVFCSDLETGDREQVLKIQKMVKEKSHSSLLHYLNSDGVQMKGTAAFIVGVMVADEWGMQINFVEEKGESASLAAFADHARVFYY